MAGRSGHPVRLLGRDLRPVHSSSSTTSAPRAGAPVHEPVAAGMFGDVPETVRLQMEIVARASADAAEALPRIIDLLVDGTTNKRTTIVDAITHNDPLREQWERTWQVLRR